MRNDGPLVDANAEDLTPLVNADDSRRSLVLSGDEDGLARNTVHVQADTGLEVVQVDEPVLGDEVDDAVLLRDLHGDREIVRGLGREEDVDGLLGEHWVRGVVVKFDDVKLEAQRRDGIVSARKHSIEASPACLCARSSPHRESKQLRRCRRTIQLQLRKARSMTLNRLAHAPLATIQLHAPLNLERARSRIARDAHQDKPLLVRRDAVVDYLRAGKRGVSVEDLGGRGGDV